MTEAARMFEPLAPDAMAAAQANAVPRGDDAEAAARKRERIAALWAEAQLLVGTIAERYLTAVRGISKPADGWPDTARFHADLPYNFAGGERHPALVLAKHDRSGELVGLHAVFLATDGKKAALEPVKKSYGTGGAVVLRRAGEPVLACEGPEDGLALVSAMSTAAAVVTAGAGTLARVGEHLNGRAAVLVADADGAGRTGARKAAERLVVDGHEAAVAVPEGGVKDVNELLGQGGPEAVRALVAAAAPASVPAAALPEVVARLAALPPLEFDRVREREAERLGVRVATLTREVEAARAKVGSGSPDTGGGRVLELPEPEPWPEAVEGEALADELAATFGRFLALPEGAATALALWVLHAHAFAASPITPRLALVSPEKRCGKTTALALVEALVPRPLPAANITAAAVFRTIEAARPTLLLDEADTFLRNSDELRGVLNAGHSRSGQVVRLVGDDHEPRAFSVWAPSAIAAIGRIPDTLADRSVTLPMRRRRPDERVERLRLDKLGDFAPLARRCARWTGDIGEALAEANPDVPAGLHDRAADNWRPLLAIADELGGDWPARSRAAAAALSSDDDSRDEQSIGTLLLGDISAVFAEFGAERIASAELAERLAVMEERPWPEWRHGKAITVRQVARLLKPFGIAPTTLRLHDGRLAKGYAVTDFADAFARYLPAPSVTPLQINEINMLGQNPSVTLAAAVTDKKQNKSLKNNDCYGVTDENTGYAASVDQPDAAEAWEVEL